MEKRNTNVGKRKRETNETINLLLLCFSGIGFVLNFTAWDIWIKEMFKERVWGSFLWFCALPFAIQAGTAGIAVFTSFLAKKLAKNKNKVISDTCQYRILGSLLYCVYYLSAVYIYRDTPIMWLLAVCPMLTASLYRNLVWLLSSLVFTTVGYTLIACNAGSVDAYRLPYVPISMYVGEALVVAAIIGCFAFAIHSQIDKIIKEIAKAEATDQARKAFFAHMSHEIRTPINAILGMDEMILREETGNDVENYAMNIKSAGQSLLAIINDILDTSKLEAGKLALVDVDYDLSSILNDCYNIVNLKAKEKNLALRIVNDPSVPKNLRGDEVRIRQIITNLLSNAIKYTKEGYVEMEVRWQKLEEDNMNLLIAVKDTGMGIPEENLQKLFDSFERLDERKNKYIEGTGLGLTITHNLLEMMGGTISVESKVDEGSIFRVVIPQIIVGDTCLGEFSRKINEYSKNTEHEEERFKAPDARVLVVDDVQMNIDVFKGLLKRTEMQIDSAMSGEQALRMVKDTKYDIIFMDHIMPEMDGIETLKRIKDSENLNKSTPVIALTANVGTDVEELYKEAGFSAYIGKPVKGKTLEDCAVKYIKGNKGCDNNVSDSDEAGEKTGKGRSLLSELKFLDTDMGMSCCANSISLYREILEEYVKDEKTFEIRDSYDRNDWESYKALMLMLKRTSLSIGAIEMSDEAKVLETAVINKAYDVIRDNHMPTLHHYEQMVSNISKVLF